MVKTLIVEDEAFVALDLQNILQELGHEVLDIVVSAEDALKKIYNEVPDLILVDVSLAGEMNGVEMVQKIRQSSDMPVIYITAYSDAATVEPMKATEPFEYMLKPFNEQVLRVTIEFALHKAASRQEQLASKRLLTTTLQSIGDAVITTDQTGGVQFLNPVAEALTGWSLQDAVDRPLGEIFSIINEQTRQPAFDPVKAVLETGKSSHLANNTLLLSKDGSEYPIEDSAAPIMDEDQIIYGVVLVFRDVTKRQQAELWLRRAQKLDSLGLLAGGIAHDFNNILGAITVNTSMLRTRELQSPQNVRLIDRIQRASEQAAELTEQLLNYAGGHPLNVELIDLNEIIELTLDLISPRKPERVTVVKELCDRPLPVLSERSQIQQVILNLVLNGYDAMRSYADDGALSLRSQCQYLTQDTLNQYLSKSTLAEGEYAQLTVTDTGCGIETATLEKMFDPFFSTKPTGSGLGLAATLGIIYQCNGGIAVDTELGTGTAFTVILPSQRGSVPTGSETLSTPIDKHSGGDQASGEISDSAHRTKDTYILIADDQADILETLDDVFTTEGYQTLLASDGVEAVQLYDAYSSQIALAVLDIRMPTMNGTEALMKITQRDPSFKAILMTGHADVATIQAYQEYLSNVHVLYKPFSYEQIIEQIQNLLNVT